MQYKGWEVSKGKIAVSSGVEISGWVIANDKRRTIAESKETAIRYIDYLEGKHE